MGNSYYETPWFDTRPRAECQCWWLWPDLLIRVEMVLLVLWGVPTQRTQHTQRFGAGGAVSIPSGAGGDPGVGVHGLLINESLWMEPADNFEAKNGSSS